MTFSLVGSLGAYGSGTPAWGTGESRTAGNLLICWVNFTVHSAQPTISSGWSTAATITFGTPMFGGATVFYKVATGGDAAPTLTVGASGQVLNGQLGEFSPGGSGTISIDQTGTSTGTTSPLVTTAGGVDVAIGELVVWATSIAYSAAATKTISSSLNNGTAVDLNDSATSTASHYANGYAITTAHSSADAETGTFTTTSIQGAATALCSFSLASSNAAANMALFQ